MTNRIAVILFCAVLALVALDAAAFGARHITFLGRKFVELLWWVAFWR